MSRRQMEMLEAGDFSKRAVVETGLMVEHVYRNKKAVRSTAATPRSDPPRSTGTTGTLDPYKNLNAGKCPHAKSPYNRPHTRSTCGKDHPVSEHNSC